MQFEPDEQAEAIGEADKHVEGVYFESAGQNDDENDRQQQQNQRGYTRGHVLHSGCWIARIRDGSNGIVNNLVRKPFMLEQIPYIRL